MQFKLEILTQDGRPGESEPLYSLLLVKDGGSFKIITAGFNPDEVDGIGRDWGRFLGIAPPEPFRQGVYWNDHV